jgi:hypothetical protein
LQVVSALLNSKMLEQLTGLSQLVSPLFKFLQSVVVVVAAAVLE